MVSIFCNTDEDKLNEANIMLGKQVTVRISLLYPITNETEKSLIYLLNKINRKISASVETQQISSLKTDS